MAIPETPPATSSALLKNITAPNASRSVPSVTDK